MDGALQRRAKAAPPAIGGLPGAVERVAAARGGGAEVGDRYIALLRPGVYDLVDLFVDRIHQYITSAFEAASNDEPEISLST